jgi:hypothetical protein
MAMISIRWWRYLGPFSSLFRRCLPFGRNFWADIRRFLRPLEESYNKQIQKRNVSTVRPYDGLMRATDLEMARLLWLRSDPRAQAQTWTDRPVSGGDFVLRISAAEPYWIMSCWIILSFHTFYPCSSIFILNSYCGISSVVPLIML